MKKVFFFLAFLLMVGSCQKDDIDEFLPVDEDVTVVTEPSDDIDFRGTPPSSIDGEDKQILLDFYDSFSWPGYLNWRNSDGTINEGDWDGVVVNSEGKVISLNISIKGFTGNILPELGNLSNLQHLDLSSNQLSGPIPAELGSLSNLVILNLSQNQIMSGPIPAELGNLSNLTELNLHNNQFSGPIPAELGNLSNLVTLDLHLNQFSGPIPAELGNLSNLQHLDFSTNKLSGLIPAELGNLSNLQHLDLSSNRNLSGSIPAELGNLLSLTELDFTYNKLSGPIPAELGNLSNLVTLALHLNQFSGPIPAELGNLLNLEKLVLAYNQLECYGGVELKNLYRPETIIYMHSGDPDEFDNPDLPLWQDFIDNNAGLCETTPETVLESLNSIVDELLALGVTDAEGLKDKLIEIELKIENGKIKPAINQLKAFKNQVASMLNDGYIDEDTANTLIEKADALIALLKEL